LQQSFRIDEDYKPVPPRRRLINQYTEDGLVLFVGAGVSYASGIPTWSDLAERVLRKSGVSEEKIQGLRKALPSYISQFELAGQRLGTYQELVKAIYESLYEKLTCKDCLERIPKKYELQVDWSGWMKVLTALEANKTLKALGDLLVIDGDPEIRRNPQIHSVLTFNADNLLELYCEAKSGGRRLVTMVDRASVGEHPNQTPVYHLHGTLDARGENCLREVPSSVPTEELQELTKELLPELVFRESEYYETIANPVSFINHTPQSFLRRLNALFIGTSLDDLNMRRWLHDSFSERVRHRTNYLRESYWRKYDAAEYEATIESIRHFWLRCETETGNDGEIWNVPKENVDAVMNNLGVQVLWCKDFQDVQTCIRDLHQFGGDPHFGRHGAQYPT
jgi:hypothetical protein